MFEVWHEAARGFQGQLGVPLVAAERAHSIVVGALGSSWLETQLARRGLPGRSFHDVHPLLRAMTGGGLDSVLHVCELAGYLTFFMHEPMLGEVLTAMRDHGKYESTFFEVAIAWRFARAGFPISFYPPTPTGGVADIAVALGGTSAIVEVSVFPGDVFERPAMVAANFITDVVSRTTGKLDLPCFIAVEVVVDDETDGNFRQELHRAVTGAIRHFAESSCLANQLKKWSFGTVLVRPVRHDEGPYAGGGGISTCVQRVPRPQYGSLHNVQFDSASRDTNWVHLTYDDSPQAQQRRIASKLKRENEQLSGVTDARIIALDVSGLGVGVLSEDDDDTRATLDRFAGQHPSVSQIWLLTKVWSETPARRLYRGVAYSNQRATRPLPQYLGRAVLADLDVLAPSA